MKISVVSPTLRPKGLEVMQECLSKQTLKDFEWLVEVGIPERGHDLNSAFNRMLKRAKGDLVVFYQDYIKIPDNGLESFYNAYLEAKDTFFTAPVGKTLDWKDVSWDWRVNKDVKMDWPRWEIDWGAAPLEALKKIGGFDEELDQFWSCDNVNVGCRADLAGFKFKNLVDNKAVAYDHDKTITHPFREKYNPQFHNARLQEFRMGKTIDYLK